MSKQNQNSEGQQAVLTYTNDIIATLRHPFLVLDKDLRVRSSNRAFYQTFSVSPEETVGRLVYDLGNGQWDIPRLRSLLEEILPQNSSFDDFEVEHEFPVIGRRYMLLNARCIYREANNTDLILLAIEDITQRRQAEEQRREIETRFTLLVKNIKDHAVFTMDACGHISTWNVAAERIFGYSESEAIGQHYSMIFTREGIQQGRPDEELQKARKSGRAEDECWHIRKNGEHFWALGIVTPTHDATGKHTGFSNILRDMTDRKRAEVALNEADRRKNEFLAMLSHELRNPLAPILNAVQLMGSGSNESVHEREVRRVIERQVRHLARLVDDLLDISRITTGRIRLCIGRVDANEIVERAVERLRPAIEEHKHELSLSLADGVVWLDSDSARLEQVVGNLLNNACKYSDVGGHIWLTVEKVDDHVVIRVRDDGIGMAPDLLPCIFDLFTQADKSLDRANGGLGIGLALAKSIVEMHHGTVEAQSEGIGRGSEFIVRLPVASETEAERTPAPSQPPTGPTTNSLRVLIVEDSIDAAKMSAMLLRSWGHEVRMVHNGPAALYRAAGFHPHVILLDIGLPDMDGYEVARHVRQNPKLKDVRLVAVTGYGQDTDRERSKEAGFDVHMVKPVEYTDLKKLLDEMQPPG